MGSLRDHPRLIAPVQRISDGKTLFRISVIRLYCLPLGDATYILYLSLAVSLTSQMKFYLLLNSSDSLRPSLLATGVKS